MGSDKAKLEVDGVTFLQFLASRFARRLGPVIVSARLDQVLDIKGAKAAYDTYEGAGPLGGLHAGLLASPDDENFALACDMPFADLELARYLVSLLQGYDAVTPMLETGVEPLFAAYRKSCVPEIERLLESGCFKVGALLQRINVLYPGVEDLKRHDPELRSFVNVNSPEDYSRVLRLFGQTPD